MLRYITTDGGVVYTLYHITFTCHHRLWYEWVCFIFDFSLVQFGLWVCACLSPLVVTMVPAVVTAILLKLDSIWFCILR